MGVKQVPDIDVVLPCYNPAPGWEDVVLEQTEALRNLFPQQRIRTIVVNDGSVFQKTADSMQRLESKATDLLLLSYPHNMGKGFALRTGVQRSLASVIVYTDIDFPYTLDSMNRVIRPVLNGEADVALGVRNKTYYDQLPAVRRWMSHFLRFANKTILRLHTSDTQGGLKAFSGDLRDTFLKTKIHRYLFDLEFVYLISRKKHLRIKSVIADLRPGILMSPVRMSIIAREAWNFLKVMITRRR